MMIGERNNHTPAVHVPPWTFADSPPASGVSFPASPKGNGANFNGADDYSFFLQTDDLAALRRYLANEVDDDPDGGGSGLDSDLPLDAYSCDNFRMFEFKIRKCARGRSHDWTDCPFAHPGEKARRRDPRFYNYSGTACPEFRKGNCKKGDGCEFAHGVFECWLHPARYRTQPCKDGLNCRRRVCFFAHTPEQLRVLSTRSESYDGSPRRLGQDSSCARGLAFMSSPETSLSPTSESPPMSPMANSLSRSLGSATVSDMVASMRQLQLNKMKSIPNSWGIQMSPRFSMSRTGFCSLPSTPTQAVARTGIGFLDQWDKGCVEEEPVMERVESGRDLRAKMFEKLSKENPLDRVEANPPEASNPDLGWVSELVN